MLLTKIKSYGFSNASFKRPQM